MKLRSGGSSAAAARWNRSSRSSRTFWKESRKMPLILHSTSTRGRPPSSPSGTSSNLHHMITAFEEPHHASSSTSALFIYALPPKTMLIYKFASRLKSSSASGTSSNLHQTRAIEHLNFIILMSIIIIIISRLCLHHQAAHQPASSGLMSGTPPS